ncbi:DNase I-like protein [Patellaria atrata CBS 101060]|uniref:DNase I-like protein n=1 Tax=Patellaria atrata CBS 101060 TaxID=1346257 RepID=A0A9P4VU78_9PEZI|nr:DNase I-like protein [Patellaria atrata CBS 101060]
MAKNNKPDEDASTDFLDQLMPGAFPDSKDAEVSSHQTLSQAVYARRSEYTRPKTIRIKVGTWNVAALKGTEKDIGSWFIKGKGVDEALGGLSISDSQEGRGKDGRERVEQQEARSNNKITTSPVGDDGVVSGGEEVELYVLGLQELVDISSPAEALRPYTDPGAANRFKTALEYVLPAGYQLVSEQQLFGVYLVIYASPSIFPEIKSVSTTSVGTGLMGYMGNKGAVTTRIVLGETTRLVFINSHLAAGADKASLERRNWDASQIMSRTRFDAITDSMGLHQSTGEKIGDEDFAFWFGDLNYRLEGMAGDDVRRLLTLHARDEYDVQRVRRPIRESTRSDTGNENSVIRSGSPISIKSVNTDPTLSDNPDSPNADHNIFEQDVIPAEFDPASLQTTLLSLLPHDELIQQQKARKAFYEGWKEGPIKFMPTYKYDVGSVGVFDSSEKRRCPSWCDRILYRTRRDKVAYEIKVKAEEEAKKKDEEMKAKGMDKAVDDEDILFDYDPDADGDVSYDEDFAETEPEVVVTREGFEDEIEQEYYTSHHRILSSDHKPLDAVFKLRYDAVIPELKAKVHAEVARDLDRAENEGRPSVTIIVDHGSTNGRNAPESEGVDFGDIQYAQTKRRSITIANTGRVSATIRFADRPTEESQPTEPFPPWLSTSFDREPDKKPQGAQANDNHDSYTLEPGDTCSVDLALKVTGMDRVRELNENHYALESILVLRVENGRDHFISVHGHWQQSIFSRSIDALTRIPEGGIRALQHQKPRDTPEPGHGKSEVKWSAPRELFRLTEAIEELVERTLAEWDMTSPSSSTKKPWEANAGWPFAQESWTLTDLEFLETLSGRVYEALDTDKPLTTAFASETPSLHRLEILAHTLLLFLQSITDGVITAELWTTLEPRIIQLEKSKSQLRVEDERTAIMEALSTTPSHNVSFVLLTSMLSHIESLITSAVKDSAIGVGSGTSRSSIDIPSSPQSPKATVRRKTLSKDPVVARRQVVQRALAAVFAEVVVRLPDRLGGKQRRDAEERAVRVLEVFLRLDN